MAVRATRYEKRRVQRELREKGRGKEEKRRPGDFERKGGFNGVFLLHHLHD